MEPGEVEAELSEHPGVTAAAVLAKGSDAQDKRLEAFLAGDPAAGDPLEWLAGRVPAHLIPASVTWVPALPLTDNGKIDRAALIAGDPGPPSTDRCGRQRGR